MPPPSLPLTQSETAAGSSFSALNTVFRMSLKKFAMVLHGADRIGAASWRATSRCAGAATVAPAPDRAADVVVGHVLHDVADE